MKLITTCYKDGKKDVIVKQYEAQAEGGGENQVVNLYPDIEYQTIIGFGGAVTEASGYVFSKLGEENKKKVIDLYYGEDGNRYNMVRSIKILRRLLYEYTRFRLFKRKDW